jgi:hypothetical protein
MYVVSYGANNYDWVTCCPIPGSGVNTFYNGNDFDLQVKTTGSPRYMWFRVKRRPQGTGSACSICVTIKASSISRPTFNDNTTNVQYDDSNVQSLMSTTNVLGGSVGINTSNPSQTLDVNGNVNISGNITSILKATGGAKISVQNAVDGGNSNGIFMWDDTDTNWGIYMATAGASKSLANGTACTGVAGISSHHVRFRVNNTSTNGWIFENSSETACAAIRASDGSAFFAGNLGIGTSNPSFKLDVASTIKAGTKSSFFGASSYRNLILTPLTGRDDCEISFEPAAESVGSNTSRWYVYTNSNYMTIGGNGSANLLTLSNNNFGVGTMAPAFKLDVGGDINFTGNLRQGGALYVGSQWSNSGTNVFLLNSNVGIGLSNPSARLHVSNPGSTKLRFDNDTTTNRHIVLFDNQATSNEHQFCGFGINSSLMRFQVNATSTRFGFFAATESNASREIAGIYGTSESIKTVMFFR